MPIEIVTAALEPSELRISSTPCPVKSRCVQLHYTVVVLHCSTGRTVLTHSPNFLRMNTFILIVDWIVGGDGKNQ
ncbi:hypothetical protein DFH07DRAFT_828162 [Mycena maculata]|uniref:Uncharacterized protein n=1 Tax=Mycena maculata TaxID=230809 RepID=A0AAD7ITB5_9AGAR|nr:hypothetical protein DFH07DRAFT_828162 [Mycena maculata]